MAASIASAARSARLPVVVVLGATGAGKSKLALELASRFKGEIISADSMQVYKDLDIITNKVTPEEQALVPHHLLDFVDPLSRYTVVDFRNQALPLVEQLLDDNTIPVVVGGTNYYIEALLWENLVDPVPEQVSTDPKDLLFHKKTDCSDKRKQSGDLSESDYNKKGKFENNKEYNNSNFIESEKYIVNDKLHALSSDNENIYSKNCSGVNNENNYSKNCSGVSCADSEIQKNSFESEKISSISSEEGSYTNEKDCSNTSEKSCSKNVKCFNSEKSFSDSEKIYSDSVKNENCANSICEISSKSSECEFNKFSNILQNYENKLHAAIKIKNNKAEITSVSEIVQSECDNFDLSEVHQDTTLPTDLLYKRLQKVDPDIASQYHPNNRRKIIRSLQVFHQTGRCHSEVLSEQHSSSGGSRHGGALRYSNAAIFWVTADQEVLDDRVNKRVDQMIDRGLLQELEDFHTKYNAPRLEGNDPAEEADYSKGIFQSIGFKEFHNYLLLSSEERKSERSKKLYEEGVTGVKLRTRQYARRQTRWIRNRFLVPSGREVPAVYSLDGSDPKCWDERVRLPAEEVLASIIAGKQPERKPEPFIVDSEVAAAEKGDKTFYKCDVCDRVIIGKLQWEAHINGARHRKTLNKKKREETQAKVIPEVLCQS